MWKLRFLGKLLVGQIFEAGGPFRVTGGPFGPPVNMLAEALCVRQCLQAIMSADGFPDPCLESASVTTYQLASITTNKWLILNLSHGNYIRRKEYTRQIPLRNHRSKATNNPSEFLRTIRVQKLERQQDCLSTFFKPNFRTLAPAVFIDCWVLLLTGLSGRFAGTTNARMINNVLRVHAAPLGAVNFGSPLGSGHAPVCKQSGPTIMKVIYGWRYALRQGLKIEGADIRRVTFPSRRMFRTRVVYARPISHTIFSRSAGKRNVTFHNIIKERGPRYPLP